MRLSSRCAPSSPSATVAPRRRRLARAGGVRCALASDEDRARRLTIGSRSLPPGVAEALTPPFTRPGSRPVRAPGRSALGRLRLGGCDRPVRRRSDRIGVSASSPKRSQAGSPRGRWMRSSALAIAGGRAATWRRVAGYPRAVAPVLCRFAWQVASGFGTGSFGVGEIHRGPSPDRVARLSRPAGRGERSMYVRIARFAGGDRNWDEFAAGVRDTIRSGGQGTPFEKASDAFSLMMLLVYREGNRGSNLVLCETEDDLLLFDASLFEVTPASGRGARTSVEMYEVVLDEKPGT